MGRQATISSKLLFEASKKKDEKIEIKVLRYKFSSKKTLIEISYVSKGQKKTYSKRLSYYDRPNHRLTPATHCRQSVG